MCKVGFVVVQNGGVVFCNFRLFSGLANVVAVQCCLLDKCWPFTGLMDLCDQSLSS